MAKKSVSTLQSGSSKRVAKCIKMVKSPKTGAYEFREEIINVDNVKKYFSEK
ncbi:MAG: DUF4295 domain-containing protein [Bacteroidia bacterium]|nr:DUF4295 domain-containing protein [Bacteroidia bacterium]